MKNYYKSFIGKLVQPIDDEVVIWNEDDVFHVSNENIFLCVNISSDCIEIYHPVYGEIYKSNAELFTIDEGPND